MRRLSENSHDCLAVIRIRGTINIRREVKDTLKFLHLSRPNHATLIPSTKPYLGMLQLVKDCVTWGEISEETLRYLIEKRGESFGGKKITEMTLKEGNFESLGQLTEDLHSTKVSLSKVGFLKPVFRLHPPSGGFKKQLKRSFVDGGESGYRGEKINNLIKKMS